MKLGEIRIVDGDLKTNYETMLETIDASEEEIIIFPQYALTGLHVGDRFKSPSFIEDVLYFNDLLRLYSDAKTIVFGTVIGSVGNLSPVILSFKDGEVYQEPIYKPTLSKFEQLFLVSKPSPQEITLDNKKWHVSFSLDSANEDTLIFGYDSFDKNLPVSRNAGIYVNALGISNIDHQIKVYTGGSYIQSKLENTVEPSKEERLFNALSLALQYFDSEILPFKPNWIIGVSGGLDSSLSVALLSLVLGKERVIGVNMPSEYSSATTKGNASHLADKLGYESLIIPIEAMTQGTQRAFEAAGLAELKNLTYENVQARLRGHTLMTLSSLRNGVVCNNGNKIETALGYATLYGDAIGVMGLLADLNKLEVGSLASYINKVHGTELIPANLIPEINENSIEWDFAPSAELDTGQVDPMKWGYHDHLVEYLLQHPVEDLLKSYVDGSIYNTAHGKYLKAYGLDDGKKFVQDLDWVLATMNGAKYKRLQSPPILSLSSINFGSESQGRIKRSYQAEQYIDEIIG